MPTGTHGLPLMGTGDWNDGMDEVGEQGRGESVWLGWFLGSLLGPFAEYADSRGDAQLARTYRAHAARLKDAAEAAWDGAVVPPRVLRRRHAARFGAERRVPHRLDRAKLVGHLRPRRSGAIAAGDGVGRVPADRSRRIRLILLLTPPFDKAEPNPGYIKGYVPGVRENGGQYTHAALWVVLAQAMLRRGDAAHELLSFINPIHRSSDRDSVKRYRVGALRRRR